MKLSVVILLLFTAVFTNAQDIFQFKNITCNFPEIKECASDGLWSENVAIKLAQFDQVYTRTINCGPPAYAISTEIQKPDLYFSVQKLVKHYKKCLKKETIPGDKIENEMLEIINKCLLIFNQQTDSVEHELRTANNSQEIIGVFKKIIIE